MLWPKKNSYKEFDNKKKFLRLENSPPPPHNAPINVNPVGGGGVRGRGGDLTPETIPLSGF